MVKLHVFLRGRLDAFRLYIFGVAWNIWPTFVFQRENDGEVNANCKESFAFDVILLDPRADRRFKRL